MYEFYNFSDAYNFIVQHGGYQYLDFIDQKRDEDYFTYQSRIIQIASRIRACMISYPKDILAYYKEHPESAAYTADELSAMTYRKLAEIRKSLGIKKKRSPKKVTKTEPAGKSYEQGIKAVQETSTRDLAAAIITDTERELESEQETILSEDEIISMYGEDLPSSAELLKLGIVPEYREQYDQNRKL